MRTWFLCISTFSWLSITPVQAAEPPQPQMHHNSSGAHSMPAGQDHAALHAQMIGAPAATPAGPTEPGQGAFATIAEILTLLRADPQTDWQRVDINALREHLIDMDRLTLDSHAEQRETDNSRIEFRVRGEGRTREAIQRMVPAHAPFVAAETGWKTHTSLSDDGVLLIVETADPADLQMLRAIGFYGFMALGAHHQPHHEAMARGQAVHQH